MEVLFFVLFAAGLGWFLVRLGRSMPAAAKVLRPVDFDATRGLDALYRAGLEEGYRRAWLDIAPIEQMRFRGYVRRAAAVSVVLVGVIVVFSGVGWWWIDRSGGTVRAVLMSLEWHQWGALGAGAFALVLAAMLAWPSWPRRTLADVIGEAGVDEFLERLLREAAARPSGEAARYMETIRAGVREATTRLVHEREAEAEERGYGLGRAEGSADGHRTGREAGYRVGYDAGLSEGERVGREKGWSEGAAAGHQEGERIGREAGRSEGIEQGRTEGARRGVEAAAKARLLDDAASAAPVAASIGVIAAERLAYARGVEAGFSLGRAPGEALSGLPLLDWWGHHPALGWLYMDRTQLSEQAVPSDPLSVLVLNDGRVTTVPRSEWERSCRSAVTVLSSLDDPAERQRTERILLDHLRHRERYSDELRRSAEAS